MITSLQKITNPRILRTIYFGCFHTHLRYGLILWGGDPESIKVFRVQRKVIRVLGKVGRQVSCRNLFRDLNILPLPCLYISEMVCWIKSNMGRMISNKEVHDYYTRQKLDIHHQFCRTNVAKNSGIIWVLNCTINYLQFLRI